VSSAVLESAAVGRLFSEDAAGPETDDGCFTLEERLDAVWHSLQGAGKAECPVCQSRVHLGDGGFGGCEGCGSRIS
jgi:hypothetical protein